MTQNESRYHMAIDNLDRLSNGSGMQHLKPQIDIVKFYADRGFKNRGCNCVFDDHGHVVEGCYVHQFWLREVTSD